MSKKTEKIMLPRCFIEDASPALEDSHNPYTEDEFLIRLRPVAEAINEGIYRKNNSVSIQVTAGMAEVIAEEASFREEWQTDMSRDAWDNAEKMACLAYARSHKATANRATAIYERLIK